MTVAGSTTNMRQAMRALLALGYSEREAQAAIRNLPAGASVSDGIKEALRALAKG